MSDIEILYTPGPKPKKIAWLGSGGFSSLDGTKGDPNCDTKYENICALANKDCKGIKAAEERGIETEVILSEEYPDLKSNPAVRDEYYTKVYRWLKEYEPDIVALTGWDLLIPLSFLNKFEYRIINVHPGNLARMECIATGEIFDAGDMDAAKVYEMVASGKAKRAITGGKAVHLAINKLLEPYVMSTVHIANIITDGGPIIARKPLGRKIDLDYVRRCISYGDLELLNSYAQGIQNDMKPKCDVRAYRKALELLTTKEIAIDKKTETLYADRQPLKYGGILMKAY